MITVSRPINGISINGDEWLLNENDEAMEFSSIKEAMIYLKLHNVRHCCNFHKE